jgi:hypothetical protein
MTPEARSICLFTTPRDKGARIKTAAAPAPLLGSKEHRAVDKAQRKTRASAQSRHGRRGLEFPEAFTGNEALDFALD